MTPAETLVTLAKELEAELNKGRVIPDWLKAETCEIPSPFFYIGDGFSVERIRAILESGIVNSGIFDDMDTVVFIQYVNEPDLKLNPYQDICFFKLKFARPVTA